MVENYNSEMTKEVMNGAFLKAGVDKIPNEISDKIVPVYEVNPRVIKSVNLMAFTTCTNTFLTAVYVTPTNKDFYLTGVDCSLIKDVTSTSTVSYIELDLAEGGTKTLCRIPGLTLTPQTAQLSHDFSHPLKLARGSTIYAVNQGNVANISFSVSIQGFVLENTLNN